MVEKREKRHDILGSILDENLDFMSGKIIKKAEGEQRRYFRLDYWCITEGDLPESKTNPIVRPFDHLKEENVIEYKTFHESLNEKTFRNYVARALLLETRDPLVNYRGKTTLTILASKKPEILTDTKYGIEQINEWKYVSHWIADLDIYIIVIRGMRGQQQGEALAFLQVLDEKCWEDVLSQKLENSKEFERLMDKINKETHMILAEKYKAEGKMEGRREGKAEVLLKVLSWTSPELVKKYEAEVQAAKTEEELLKIEEKIRKEIESRK